MNKNISIYKYELAVLLGITPRTLAYLLNRKYYEILKKNGYNKHQKILYPAQLKCLDEILEFGYEN